MRLTKQREKEIREHVEYSHSIFHKQIHIELLAEIDALRAERNELRKYAQEMYLLAHSWMNDYQKLKDKYEPLILVESALNRQAPPGETL